tara:strand:+ start:1159 stop:1605 length:447 start_codon:yes stop_codon:yes gene_type:complete
MSFFRFLIILSFIFLANKSFADESAQKQEVLEQTAEIAKQLEEDDEVPLNDPFAGNEGNNSMTNIPEGEAEDEMSLYNFKLVGLISGKDHSYISLVNSGGEVVTLGLGQYLGKIKLIDLRLSEAIFKKEDESYIILDFNNQIRETNEY